MSEPIKNIVLGVCGGIAIYKSADLCSRLTANGYAVRVVMTANAVKLMSPQIFLTLSQNPVILSLFDTPAWQPEHIHLAQWADLLVVAPATANFIGKFANGIADDALTTTAMAHRKSVLVAPAMNEWMWQSPALQENLACLKKRGIFCVGPESGRLACGTNGIGRMSNTEEIVRTIQQISKECLNKERDEKK